MARPKTLADRFWAKVQKSDGCWLWTGAIRTPAGYGMIQGDGSKRFRSTHRVSWELANGPIPDGLMVLHRCDVRRCVRPDHLFVGSQLDNMRDAAAKRRHTFGERSNLAKLTADDVRAIRARRATGEYCKDIAADFGINRTNVIAIAKRKSWRHVA